MRRIISISVLALACLSAHAYASGPIGTVPDFRSIEDRLDGDDALAEGRTAIMGVIPPGTKVADAEAILKNAGALCKPKHHDAQTVRCIYNDVRIGDDAIDHVQWNTLLHIVNDKVVGLSLNREVDRHSLQD
ncbi:MAG TPA: hypothetical protein VKQ27_17040 [Acetobacteraceae bacterium]|nr:hypothetical protein [Acetobacteraceae bacterium]